MRTVKFRDVLWSIAYRNGQDPAVDLLKDQAEAFVSYINAWVRRLWDQVDWPEWTAIYRYMPNSRHYISWDALPNDFVPLPRPPEPAAPPWKIGKPLKVYLVDPRTTWAPVDTPFRATEWGIHCGFEHGDNVWMKFMPRPPEYTSTEWDVANSYHQDDLVYWPVTGEVYKSKINNNTGHEPDDILLANQSPLNVEETRPFTPPNPGSPEFPGIWLYDPGAGITEPGGTGALGIWRVNAVLSTSGGKVPVPNPAPIGSIFTVQIFDASHTLLATSTVTATDRLRDLQQIWPELAKGVANGLPGFSVTLNISGLSFDITNASGFTTEASWTVSASTVPLETVHVQTYVPAPPPIFTDPPSSGSVFLVQVFDGSHALLGDATVTANGTDTIATIAANQRTQLLAEPLLSGFTITLDGTLMEIEHNSVFSLNATWTRASVVYPLNGTLQFTAYQPAIPPSTSQPQILRLAITEQQVLVNATYSLTFITGGDAPPPQQKGDEPPPPPPPPGQDHTVTYVAQPSDNALAILTGLVNAMIATQIGDPFFAGVTSVLDTVGPSVSFTIDVQFGESALHATLQPPGVAFWDIIHFPFALMDQVVRGAYADSLAEQGQSDKAGAQEQIVPTEQQVRTAGELAPQYQQLSDQTQPRSRYQVK